MIPVDEIPVSNYHNDPFQETRIEEVHDFLNTDCECAEVKTKGTVSMSREREQYKKAIRHCGYANMKKILVIQRKKKLYLKKVR